MIDYDSRPDFPNLVIMKLSKFHKSRGNDVILSKGPPGILSYFNHDKAYISCIFKKNKLKVEKQKEKIPIDDVEVGGYGVNHKMLCEEIEHLMPDYELYGVDYSMGFTTRGCIRNCDFCHVNYYEGLLKEWSDPEEFLHPNHDKVILLDNNYLASKKWKEKFDKIFDLGYNVCLTSGLDARLIDKEKADYLANHKLHGRKFKDTSYYTAWDRMEDEEEVLRGIKNLIEAGVTPRYIRPYILVGYNTYLYQDLYRFRKLRELGVYPFVMPYNNRNHPLKRYGQRPAIYKSCTWEEYKREKDIECKESDYCGIK